MFPLQVEGSNFQADALFLQFPLLPLKRVHRNLQKCNGLCVCCHRWPLVIPQLPSVPANPLTPMAQERLLAGSVFRSKWNPVPLFSLVCFLPSGLLCSTFVFHYFRRSFFSPSLTIHSTPFPLPHFYQLRDVSISFLSSFSSNYVRLPFICSSSSLLSQLAQLTEEGIELLAPSPPEVICYPSPVATCHFSCFLIVALLPQKSVLSVPKEETRLPLPAAG